MWLGLLGVRARLRCLGQFCRMGNTCASSATSETSGWLWKGWPEVRKRTKKEEPPLEPQKERKTRGLCRVGRGKRTFQGRVSNSKKADHAKSWGVKGMNPDILDLATWTLGKSRLDGVRGWRKRVSGGLLCWASLGLSTQQNSL